MKNKKSVKNVFFGITSQIVIICLGLIVPRIVLLNYGSDTNGLTSTIRQIFVYMALLEAGIGQATLNALYKPVAANDREKISSYMTTSIQYYRKVTIFYFTLVIIMGISLPYVLDTLVQPIIVFGVVFFEGLTNIITFYFLASWKQLLSATGRYYIIQNITMATTIISYAVKIVLSTYQVNIAVIQIAFFIVYLIQLFIYKRYLNRVFPWVSCHAKLDNDALKNKNAFMLSQIATTVFTSTDLIVLSIICGTQIASVYNVYGLIYSNLNSFLNSIYFGLVYILGEAWNKGMSKYIQIHDIFDSLTHWLITSTMSVAYILTLPFISLYTKGVDDVNYIYKYLPLMLAIIQLLSWYRYVLGNLSAISGHARPVSRISTIEAGVNLTLSIFLGLKLGMLGVLLATLIALPIKVFYLIIYCNKTILKRSMHTSIKNFTLGFVLFSCSVFFQQNIDLHIKNYADLFKWGFILSLIIYTLFLVITIILNIKSFKPIYTKIKFTKYQLQKIND